MSCYLFSCSTIIQNTNRGYPLFLNVKNSNGKGEKWQVMKKSLILLISNIKQSVYLEMMSRWVSNCVKQNLRFNYVYGWLIYGCKITLQQDIKMCCIHTTITFINLAFLLWLAEPPPTQIWFITKINDKMTDLYVIKWTSFVSRHRDER